MKNFKKSFARFIRKFFVYSAIAGVIVTSVKCLEFFEEQKRERIRRERRDSLLSSACIALIAIGAFATGLCVAIRNVKKTHGGYLVDLFDRDEYDVVSPEEEDSFEDLVRSELRHSDDDDVATPRLHKDTIPVDDEASEEDYN